MSNKFLSAVSAGLALVLAGQLAADAKASHKTRHSYRPGNYLVPPPPAYMPSILPELKMASSETPQKKKPRTTVQKHIYFAQGHEEPEPVKPNKNVTYWNQKDASQTGVVSYE